MFATTTRKSRTAATSGTRRSSTRAEPAPSARRDAVLTQHMGLVHHVARQLANRLSTQADLDEMISAGSLGLMQAFDSFDTGRGLSFSTYAVPRIRGAILDELRKQDHVPRNVRRRTRDLGRARDSLANVLRREPTEEEMSRLLSVPADMIRRWQLDAEGASMVSLEQPVRADSASGGALLGDTIPDESTHPVDALLNHEHEVARLKLAIAGLKEQERTVLALNFFEELKLQEIATVLKLSVCRISQIRTAALAKLRLALIDLRAA